MTTRIQEGVRPPPGSTSAIVETQLGGLGAVGDGDDDDLDAVVDQIFQKEEDQERGGVVEEGIEKSDEEEGQPPNVRNAPRKPSQEEVDQHNVTHIPRRMWCRVCAEAAIQEDLHVKSKIDPKQDGGVEIHMDYKEVRKGHPPCSS